MSHADRLRLGNYDKYNPHIPNIETISGALITLSLSILILNSQCIEGAGDGIDIWGVYSYMSKISVSHNDRF